MQHVKRGARSLFKCVTKERDNAGRRMVGQERLFRSLSHDMQDQGWPKASKRPIGPHARCYYMWSFEMKGREMNKKKCWMLS